jgi:transcriptional regulator with XRE-family HTH domain
VPTKVPNSRLLKRLGARLRTARAEKGLSQESLAFAAGLDRSYVSGIERGEFNVSILTLSRLAKTLGVGLATLLDGD